jgi:hypothetical protein
VLVAHNGRKAAIEAAGGTSDIKKLIKGMEDVRCSGIQIPHLMHPSIPKTGYRCAAN